MTDLTRHELEAVAERAADKAIAKVLMRLGVDMSAPLDMQRDFAHLRKWRQSVDMVVPLTFKTAIAVVVTGILSTIFVIFSRGH